MTALCSWGGLSTLFYFVWQIPKIDKYIRGFVILFNVQCESDDS